VYERPWAGVVHLVCPPPALHVVRLARLPLDMYCSDIEHGRAVRATITSTKMTAQLGCFILGGLVVLISFNGEVFNLKSIPVGRGILNNLFI
jgi:hypothetical protein